jgi:hypothetical protein
LFAIPSRSNNKNITNNSHPLTIPTRSSVLLDSAILYSCGSLYRAHFRISFACRKQTYLYRNTWQVWWTGKCLILHSLHKFSVNADRDCGNTLADPHLCSVALGDSTGVKTWSFIFISLKTKFDSKKIDCAIVSVLNCWQTSTRQTMLTEFWDKAVVCLPLKFSAGGNVLTFRFIETIVNTLWLWKWDVQLYFSSCLKLRNFEVAFYETFFYIPAKFITKSSIDVINEWSYIKIAFVHTIFFFMQANGG